MNKTVNLELNKPLMTDFVSESVEKVFGENFDILDEKISDIDEDLNNKADKEHTHSQYATAAALETGLSGKADSSHTHSQYAPKASPAFTGTPTAPTASKGTSTTQVATTKFVQDAIDGIVIPEDTSELAHSHANKSVLDGITSSKVTAWDSKAEGSHTHSDLAPKASPAFTGTPTAPTASKGTSSTQVATTKFVQDAIDGIVIPEDTSELAHSHANKTVIDKITQAMLAAWDAAATHASNSNNPHAVGFNQIIVQLSSSADFDDLPDGMFFFRNNTTNAPVTGTGLAFQVSPAGGVKFQMAVHDYHGKAEIYYRSYVASSWSVWYSSLATKDSVGLGNVTNESKTTMFTSPSFTGTPTAPTPASGTSSTQIATTAFVEQEIVDFVPYIELTASSSSPLTLSDYITPAIYWIDHNAGLSNSSNSSLFTDLPSDIIGDMSSRGLSNGNGIHLVVEKAVKSTRQYHKQVLKIYCSSADNGDYILSYTRLVSSSYIGTWKLMGDPVSVTASAGTSNKMVATTEFVMAAIAAITASQIGAAAASHNHSASNITSGTLPVTRGGTGITTLTGVDYDTSRVRGFAFQTTVPDSIANGHLVGVYT